MSDRSSIAFFDLDGTITHSDSFFCFLVFDRGWFRVMFGGIVLAPWLLLHAVGVISASRAKLRVFRYFFKGRNVMSLQRTGVRFGTRRLPGILKDEAVEQIAWHKKRQHTVCVVTASSDIWLRHWCDLNGLLLLSTEFESLDGVFTGRYNTPNCTGAEKVNRIRQAFNLESFRFIYAYGNSAGDNQMLDLKNSDISVERRQPVGV